MVIKAYMRAKIGPESVSNACPRDVFFESFANLGKRA